MILMTAQEERDLALDRIMVLRANSYDAPLAWFQNLKRLRPPGSVPNATIAERGSMR
jgi:hypothetical protein